MDIPWRQLAATPRVPRGYSVEATPARIFRGGVSRRRRGRRVDIPRRRLATPPRASRGYSVEACRGAAAGAAWIFRATRTIPANPRRVRGAAATCPRNLHNSGRGATRLRGISATPAAAPPQLVESPRLRPRRRHNSWNLHVSNHGVATTRGISTSPAAAPPQLAKSPRLRPRRRRNSRNLRVSARASPPLVTPVAARAARQYLRTCSFRALSSASSNDALSSDVCVFANASRLKSNASTSPSGRGASGK